MPVQTTAYVSMWLALIARALLISGISGRDRCPDRIGLRSHLVVHTGIRQKLCLALGWARGATGQEYTHIFDGINLHQKLVHKCAWACMPEIQPLSPAQACPLCSLTHRQIRPLLLYRKALYLFNSKVSSLAADYYCTSGGYWHCSHLHSDQQQCVVYYYLLRPEDNLAGTCQMNSINKTKQM